MAEPDPKVFLHPASKYDDAYLPQFPAVASMVDTYARRIPWWAWIIAGYAFGTGFLGKMLTKVKVS